MESVASERWPIVQILLKFFFSSFDKTINDQEEDKDNPPKVRIEGPFGGGNQDWYKFEVGKKHAIEKYDLFAF